MRGWLCLTRGGGSTMGGWLLSDSWAAQLSGGNSTMRV